jgi:hypothetical protein
MAKEQKSFVKGRMNKSVDERLLPDGEYVDAQNLRLGSTELTEVGSGENTKGNVKLTTLQYKGDDLSGEAVCIGAFADDARETVYWFVHDPFNDTAGGVVDMIVSFNTQSQQLTYHVVSTSVLNFNPTYRVNAVNLIDNLLFFTDDYNQPRKINIKRAYPQPNASHVDQITELDISVIKPQPVEAPSIELQNNSEDSNYIEDTFISFAYRYKYKDGEYSATSQFSQPAFFPDKFSLDTSSMTNEGMTNEYNSVKVSFNTGVDNVIGVDVLYKESDSNVIYVAKKIDKEKLSIPSNIQYSINFSNGDIYTILNDGEILRLYDNVPRLAKAQTIMGRRLMYGNYLEGRNLIDKNGNDVNVSYNVSPISEDFFSNSLRFTDQDTSTYEYNLTGSPLIIDGAFLEIDVSNQDILDYCQPSVLEIIATFEPIGVFDGSGNQYSGYDVGTEFTIQFTYNVQGAQGTAYAAYGTQLFENLVGVNTFEPFPNGWQSGITFTDAFNSATIPPTPIDPNLTPDLSPLRSARNLLSPLPEGIFLSPQPNNTIHLVPNAIQYFETGNQGSSDYYQFFRVKNVDVNFDKNTPNKSLHSNRSYQVGVVYQDIEGRQTTVFESPENTVYLNADKSDKRNRLKVNIPIDMLPPVWADRYKFVLKQNRTDYETIYSSVFYRDLNSSDYWVKLDGEQGNKVSVGQNLIVKRDASGVLNDIVKTTVLDVVSQPTNFIESDSDDTVESSGVYAKFRPQGWVLADNVSNIITSGTIESGSYNNPPDRLLYPLYDVVVVDPTTTPPTTAKVNWQIPVGSVVDIDIQFVREERGNLCGSEVCKFQRQYIASQSYTDFKGFWDGEGINVAQSDCSQTNDDSGENTNVYYQDSYNQALPAQFDQTNTYTPEENKYQFYFDADNGLNLALRSGSQPCVGIGNGKKSFVKAEIIIKKADGVVVFETEPSETNGEVYFENEQSFPIVNGFHMSGDIDDDQDQTSIQPAIVNLTFFNCFTFFNGVESYKSKDSLTGKKFYLGQRVTAVSEQDYREVRRESSITYSGVYNEQTNVNRTNEFNLGLANYKDCEIAYGPIQVIHGRRTDLLTLQEDRISYISIGKNLLTAADGVGVLTSVPEVLGTQVARVEEYGISDNPESFCHYGSDIYFTDSKRSSVIQLKGGSSGEALNVISDAGMDTWFRDLFQTSFGYQKLGGYDPYMDEYVLSANTNLLPAEPIVYNCGAGSRVYTGLLSAQQETIDAGLLFGEVTVFIRATNEVNVTITYNGVEVANTTDVGEFNMYFDKNVPTVRNIFITITPTDPNGSSTTEIFVGCPVADTITIVPIMLTSAVDAFKLIHNFYGYTDNTVSPPYTSVPQGGQQLFISQFQQSYFSANLVSQYGPFYTGQQGTGSTPIDGSSVLMASSKLPNDTFDLNVNTNQFRYLRSSQLYENNAADIAQLIADSTSVTIGGSTPIFIGNFAMPAGGDGDYLYLIWDYRENAELKLCYSNSSDTDEACCECFSSTSCIPFLGTTVEVDSATACGLSPTTTYYTSALTVGGVTNTQPIVGTTVYSYLGCSSGNTVGAGFIKLTDNTWVETDSNGEVITVGNC